MATVNSRVSVVNLLGLKTAAAIAAAINLEIEVLEAAGFVVTVAISQDTDDLVGGPKVAYLTGVLAAFAGDAAASGLVKVLSLSVGFADLTAAATSQSLDFAAALPEGARWIAARVGLTTPFTGGVMSAVVVDVGTPGDVDALVDAADVFAAAVDGEASAVPEGIAPHKVITGDTAARTPAALFLGTGDNVQDLTAGACQIDIYYV